ncbi:MAG: cytochrome c-type biogenesis CcmF C-terminal domain-containing protein [Euryarchaeota archaeon]|nr:cytochrome c-type biogenesis CcmF C-terminal domain-containing protein [Euryarchaeota archaeon]
MIDWQSDIMKSTKSLEFISTRNAMLATIIMFSVLFMILIMGMLIPLFADIALDAGWFNNRTMLPTLLLALLLGVCLLLLDVSPTRILAMVAVVIVATILSGAASPFNNTPIDVAAPVLLFATLAIVYRIIRLPKLTLRSVSPHIIHIGIVLILVGIVVSTNMRIDGSTVIQNGEFGDYKGQPYSVKVTGISNQYEGAPYDEHPGSSYVTLIDFELYNGDTLIDHDAVKFITDYKWGQSYATNYVHRSLTEEVFITTKMVEGDYANLYMRTAPWITAVWGGILLMSLGIVLLMYSVRIGKEGAKAAETIKEREKEAKKDKSEKREKRERSGKREDKRGEEEDIDGRYEDLLQKELSELKVR